MVDLEMDELNQHECMAAMIALVEHMQRNNITPKSEQVSGAGRSRQVWTSLLRSYDHILSIYKCIYLSIHLCVYPRDIIFLYYYSDAVPNSLCSRRRETHQVNFLRG